MDSDYGTNSTSLIGTFYGSFIDGSIKSRPLTTSQKLMVDVVYGAMDGDFSGGPRLLDLFFSTEAEYEQAQIAMVLGDLGGKAIFEALNAEVRRGAHPELSPVASGSLVEMGHLDAADTLLQEMKRFWDRETYALYLSRLLESSSHFFDTFPKFGDDDFEAYEFDVAYRVEELREAGLEAAWGGREIDVNWLLSLAGRPFFQSEEEGINTLIWRHRIEAATGLDGRSFHSKGQFQPLNAAAAVSAYLKTNAVEFIPGRRYFFGHLIK